MFKNKKVIYLILFPIFMYIGFLIFLFINQKDLIYFPSKVLFENCNTFEKNEQKNFKGTNFYEHKGTNKNLIIFFHGNASRACDNSYIKKILEKTNDSIIFVEYYGYADKNKSPNITAILNNVTNIGEYVKATKQFENIYTLGISIGTGPASYYAGNFKTDKLLLISPYSDFYEVAADIYPIFPIKYLLTENYNSTEYLKNYKNELLIIHGKNDITVPTKFGIKLYNSVDSQNKKLMLIENGNHDNLLGIENVEDGMVRFLR